jgi:hypothetical protein
MANQRIDEKTGNVVVASLAVWGSVVAGAAFEDAFGKFDARSVAYFAVGVALYALAAYRLDRGMHEFILHFSRRTIIAAAFLMAATLGVASLAHWPALAVFMAPLAVVACVAAVEKLATRATKVRGKSPAGNRAVI